MFNEFFSFIFLIFSLIAAVWFILFPVTFYFILRNLYGRHSFIKRLVNTKTVLLELIPPRELEKSPRLMESFYSALMGTDTGGNLWARTLHGHGNPSFSLEIVSTEGVAHFYIRTPVNFRNLVETALYAQFPDVEIVEAHDYTQDVPQVFPNKEWDLWGMDLMLIKPDAFPIKTYKYFIEDVTGNMIDPLAGLLESYGAVGPGQHMWLQFILTADRPTWFKDNAQQTIDAFVGRSSGKSSSSIFGRIFKDLMDVFSGVLTGWLKPVEYTPFEEAQKAQEQPLEFRLTPGEKLVLTQLEENVAKDMFTTKLRMIHVARRDVFDKTIVSGTMGALKQFNDNFTNGFRPEDDWSKTDADYIFKTSTKNMRKRRLLERYRDRDSSGKTFHLSTAEMATLFHLPDMSVMSPSVRFVDSRRGSAPSNLPLG